MNVPTHKMTERPINHRNAHTPELPTHLREMLSIIPTDRWFHYDHILLTSAEVRLIKRLCLLVGRSVYCASYIMFKKLIKMMYS